MKMYLAGQSGDVARCKKVPNDVCFRMNESLKEISQQKLERRINREEGNLFRSSSLEQDLHNLIRAFQLMRVVVVILMLLVHWVRGKYLKESILIFLKGLPMVRNLQLRQNCKVLKNGGKLIYVWLDSFVIVAFHLIVPILFTIKR